jgi:hypothetical protein
VETSVDTFEERTVFAFKPVELAFLQTFKQLIYRHVDEDDQFWPVALDLPVVKALPCINIKNAEIYNTGIGIGGGDE